MSQPMIDAREKLTKLLRNAAIGHLPHVGDVDEAVKGIVAAAREGMVAEHPGNIAYYRATGEPVPPGAICRERDLYYAPAPAAQECEHDWAHGFRVDDQIGRHCRKCEAFVPDEPAAQECEPMPHCTHENKRWTRVVDGDGDQQWHCEDCGRVDYGEKPAAPAAPSSTDRQGLAKVDESEAGPMRLQIDKSGPVILLKINGRCIGGLKTDTAEFIVAAAHTGRVVVEEE